MNLRIILVFAACVLVKCQNATNETETNFEVQILNTVNRCRCNITEVFSDNKCIYDPRLEDKGSSDTSLEYVVKQLECAEDSMLVSFDITVVSEEKNGTISLDHYEDMFVSPDKYCSEDTLVNNTIMSSKKICFDSPIVPRCCENQERPVINITADFEYSIICEKSATVIDNLPTEIKVNNSFLSWDNTNFYKGSIDCAENYEIVQYELNRVDSFLFYSTGRPNYYKDDPFLYTSDYCLDDSGEDVVKVFLCKPACFEDDCVRKCCETNKFLLYNEKSDKCVEDISDVEFDLPFKSENESSSFGILHGKPNCKPQLRGFIEDISLMSNGSLEINNAIFNTSEFCIDRMKKSDGNKDMAVIYCFDERSKDKSCHWPNYVIIACLIVSCFFIILTLFVYISVDEIYVKLFSKCIISESLSQFFVSILSIILMLTERQVITQFCIGAGILHYFFSMSTFFWLNVMCIDMYLTLKSIVPMSDSKSNKRKWLMIYSSYAWGIPLVFTISAIVIDSLEDTEANDHIIRPKIFKLCYIDEEAQWIYRDLLPIILLSVNIVLFILVSINLVKQKRALAKVLHSSESSSRAGGNKNNDMNNNKDSALLCVKLFFLMGAIWIFSIISYLIGIENCIFMVIIDSIHSLRGLFLFLIFVCKKDVRNLVKKRWRRKKKSIIRRVTRKQKEVKEDSEEEQDKSHGSTRSDQTNTSSLASFKSLENDVNSPSSSENLALKDVEKSKDK